MGPFLFFLGCLKSNSEETAFQNGKKLFRLKLRMESWSGKWEDWPHHYYEHDLRVRPWTQTRLRNDTEDGNRDMMWTSELRRVVVS